MGEGEGGDEENGRQGRVRRERAEEWVEVRRLERE